MAKEKLNDLEELEIISKIGYNKAIIIKLKRQISELEEENKILIAQIKNE